MLKRFGLREGPDLLFTAILTLARRIESLERRVADLEGKQAGSKLRRYMRRMSASP